jgi:hypothetical protein
MAMPSLFSGVFRVFDAFSECQWLGPQKNVAISSEQKMIKPCKLQTSFVMLLHTITTPFAPQSGDIDFENFRGILQCWTRLNHFENMLLLHRIE